MRLQKHLPDIIYRRPTPFVVVTSAAGPPGYEGGDPIVPEPSWMPNPDAPGPAQTPKPEGDPVPPPADPMPKPVPQQVMAASA